MDSRSPCINRGMTTSKKRIAVLGACGIAAGFALAIRTHPADACSCVYEPRRYQLDESSATGTPWPPLITVLRDGKGNSITDKDGDLLFLLVPEATP